MFSNYVWRITTNERVVYLTFDDGPHPTITPWVLELLKQYKAKGSFFCIGDNVIKYPEVYQQILSEGHSIGNHTHHHLNGWKTKTEIYLDDVSKAAGVIQSNLFRPPYGKITSKKAKGLSPAMRQEQVSIVMWDVLSADFDRTTSPQQCAANVLSNVRPGSIVVFHDSEKAFPNLQYALPIVLNNLKNEGYRFEKI